MSFAGIVIVNGGRFKRHTNRQFKTSGKIAFRHLPGNTALTVEAPDRHDKAGLEHPGREQKADYIHESDDHRRDSTGNHPPVADH